MKIIITEGFWFIREERGTQRLTRLGQLSF